MKIVSSISCVFGTLSLFVCSLNLIFSDNTQVAIALALQAIAWFLAAIANDRLSKE